MSFGISKSDLDLITNEIKQHLGSTKNPKLFIYGSRVKGNHREFSDIDILLKAENYDVLEISNIDFENLDTPYKIDFVLDKDLFEGYREEIESHMVLIE